MHFPIKSLRKECEERVLAVQVLDCFWSVKKSAGALTFGSFGQAKEQGFFKKTSKEKIT